jgi:hypothetical protein
MDANDLVSLLRRHDVAATSPRRSDEPTDAEAVRRWAESRGMVRGAYASPPPRALKPLVDAWCLERGWHLAPTAIRVGQGLRLLGLRRRIHDRRAGFGVPRAVAAALWAEVGEVEPDVKARRVVPQVPKRPRRLGLVHKESVGSLRYALVDSMGCVWKDAAQAAKQLGNTRKAVANAGGPASSGYLVVGKRYWRRLHNPAEWLKVLPADARFGVPGLMCWCSVVHRMVPYVP